jgi:integrase
MGRRNYAILLLLARLGLRAGELVTLRLEDIDWDNGDLLIRSKKGPGLARMPLPTEVGKALAQYLKEARPKSSCRNVFIRTVAPYGPISASTTISGIVRKAIQKAEVRAPRMGAHVFRHSLATIMLGRGASLDQIGQVLHRDPDSTAIYAKVELNALRPVVGRGSSPDWPPAQGPQPIGPTLR